jgi:hypothetical protein
VDVEREIYVYGDNFFDPYAANNLI